MLFVTSAIHAGAMMLAIRTIRWVHAPKKWHTYRVSLVVIIMSLAGFVESVVWAVTYLVLGAIEGLENAIYFAIVTYTTLGYGDVVLEQQWQLLAAFSSINGIIMFGWSTAIVLAAVQNIYFPSGLAARHKNSDRHD
jgi:voltage-gated potassium channel Kch